MLSEQNRVVFYCFRPGDAYIINVSENFYSSDSIGSYYNSRNHRSKINGGIVMKVVMFESPKFLKGILRLIFKIKKQDDVT